MPGYLDERNIPVSVEDTAAGTDVESAVYYADRKMDIREVWVASNAALTTDVNDYVTIELKQGANVVATLSTVATGLTAKTFRQLTLTAANARIEAGETLTVAITNAGSNGKATNNLQFSILAAMVN